MGLPAPFVITPEQIGALSARIGLPFDSLRLSQPSGMINSVYALDEQHVLRVPQNHPSHIEQLRREAIAIPAAVAAGVRTAGIIVFDDTCEVLPAPFLVVERIHGRDLERAGLDAIDCPHAWRDLGRDLGRLHAAPLPHGLAAFPSDEYDAIVSADPRGLVERRAAEGWISSLEARWLLSWLERLAPYASSTAPKHFVHADVQMSNIMLDGAVDSYLALIDWGCARCADPAMDFLSMPLCAVPHLLDGCREIAPMPEDEAAEGRILWRRLQLLLSVLPRGAAPDAAWGERPVAWLVDLMRFFLDAPGPRWREVVPATDH